MSFYTCDSDHSYQISNYPVNPKFQEQQSVKDSQIRQKQLNSVCAPLLLSASMYFHKVPAARCFYESIPAFNQSANMQLISSVIFSRLDYCINRATVRLFRTPDDQTRAEEGSNWISLS